MSDKKVAFVFGCVEQFRDAEKNIVPGNLIRAVIESALLPESRATVKEVFVRRVFSNGGAITNREIVAIARELAENATHYVEILEGRGALERLGYSREELSCVERALLALDSASKHHIGSIPEKLHPFEDAVCVAVGFRFTKYNRNH